MRAALRPFMPALWLAAWFYYVWAEHDIDPLHRDVLEVHLKRRHYAALLGIRDASVRPHPSLPRHWNCRCRQPLPLVRK